MLCKLQVHCFTTQNKPPSPQLLQPLDLLIHSYIYREREDGNKCGSWRRRYGPAICHAPLVRSLPHTQQPTLA